MDNAAPTVAEVIASQQEEIGRLQQALADLADRMEYRGNSISWTHSKLQRYQAALDDAWTALKEAGIHADGKTDVAAGIRLLAARVLA